MYCDAMLTTEHLIRSAATHADEQARATANEALVQEFTQRHTRADGAVSANAIVALIDHLAVRAMYLMRESAFCALGREPTDAEMTAELDAQELHVRDYYEEHEAARAPQ